MYLRAISVPMLLLVCWVLGLASSCASDDEQQVSERPSEEGRPAAAAETTSEARPAAREPKETTAEEPETGAEPTDAPERTTTTTTSSDLAGLLADVLVGPLLSHPSVGLSHFRPSGSANTKPSKGPQTYDEGDQIGRWSTRPRR